MSDAITISLITGSFSLVGIALTAYVNYRLKKYHKEVNGRMQQFIETAEALGKEKGKAEEKRKTKIK